MTRGKPKFAQINRGKHKFDQITRGVNLNLLKLQGVKGPKTKNLQIIRMKFKKYILQGKTRNDLYYRG